MLSCNEVADHGFKTCSQPDHRGLETKYTMTSKAMFQLRERFKCSYPTAGSLNTNDTEDSDNEVDEESEVIEDDCDGKPAGGNQKFRARFGQRRTHNDELCVASCGIILGRTTFYGSEAPSAVQVCCHYPPHSF